MAKGQKKDKGKVARSCRPKNRPKKLPKKKCCISKDKCRRCPLLALKHGTLPEGYTVKKRKLVKVSSQKGRAPKKLPAAA